MQLDLIDIAKKALPFFPRYREFARFLEESSHWDATRLREYQFHQLRNVLHHAYANSPFYKLAFDKVDFRPEEFTDISQLKALPILTRADVAKSVNQIRARNFQSYQTRHISTSGTSTGTPLQFTENWNAAFCEQIFITDLWKRIGYSENDRKAILRGNVIFTSWHRRPWRKTESSLFLSMYHLTPVTAREYAAMLRKYRPKWLHVYPSALVFLIQLLGEKEARDSLGSLGIRGVFCGSEKLYDWQRKLIEDIVQARPFSWYGMTEKVMLAGECEKCTALHIYPQYGFLETVPHRDGQMRVVATGFLNHATPFIRYEVGDLIVLGAKHCSQCGRHFQLIEEVLGREMDFVFTKNGVVPFSFSIASIHSDAWEDVAEWQIAQEKPGRIVVMIVPSDPNRKLSIEQKVKRELQRRFQASLAVDIRWMTQLPRTSSGKFKYFIQMLDLGAYSSKGGVPDLPAEAATSRSAPYTELPASRSYSYFDTTYPELNKMIYGGMRYLFFARQFQWKSREEMRDYQLHRLRRVLELACQKIPFYQQRFKQVGFAPGDLKSLDDLKHLPVLQKQEVRDHFWELFDPRQSRNGILCQTSGTTGEPLRFLLSREQVWMEWANIWRCWIWFGYRPYDRVVAFRHYEPKPGQPICNYEAHSNTLFFSVFDMDEVHLPDYVRAFNRFGPKIVRGYPSSIYILASFARERRLQVHSPNAIITSSETLLPQYRDLIEEVFDCPVYDWYGTNERVVSACQCERRESYHLSAGEGIAEYLDLSPHGERDPEAKSLVVTSLVNTVMPLIRYRVGDLVFPQSGVCECGRGLPLVRSILGRVDDIIITGDNRYVSPVRFYVLFQEFDMVRQFQIVQSEPDEVLVRIDSLREFTSEEVEHLRQKMRRVLGDRVSFEIEFVKEIQPERSGKVRNVISPVSRFTQEMETVPG
ncbi:MAG: phenylacetate--CoA ligase family protein [Verrucomicrobiae bacterium]|nr:phenylacetate--CoA ligase family protein [Verrucomicrobiae bacterium]